MLRLHLTTNFPKEEISLSFVGGRPIFALLNLLSFAHPKESSKEKGASQGRKGVSLRSAWKKFATPCAACCITQHTRRAARPWAAS